MNPDQPAAVNMCNYHRAPAVGLTLPVGLERLASGTWNVFFGPIHLGWLDERDYRVRDHRGHSHRERHLSPIR